VRGKVVHAIEQELAVQAGGGIVLLMFLQFVAGIGKDTVVALFFGLGTTGRGTLVSTALDDEIVGSSVFLRIAIDRFRTQIPFELRKGFEGGSRQGAIPPGGVFLGLLCEGVSHLGKVPDMTEPQELSHLLNGGRQKDFLTSWSSTVPGTMPDSVRQKPK
jgi:hypothetical protein